MPEAHRTGSILDILAGSRQGVSQKYLSGRKIMAKAELGFFLFIQKRAKLENL